MPLHVFVVDRRSDFPWGSADRLVVPAKEFVVEAARRLPASARVINLCRDLSYLSLGYYCSLLAEARGQKVIPSVEVMLDLHWKRLLRIALPEVNELLRRTFRARPKTSGRSRRRFSSAFRMTSSPDHRSGASSSCSLPAAGD